MRKALEELIFEGVISESVKVGEKTWKIQTLQSNDHLEATSATADYDPLSRIYALKMEILARALKSVENIPLEETKESLEFVKKLQPVIVNKLYDEYEKLQNKQEELFRKSEEVKN